MGRRADVSNENRKKIVRSYLDRTSIGQIARDMNIHKSTVSCIVTKYLKTGSYCKERRQRNTPKKLNDKQIEAIRMWVEQDLYISLQAIANRCLREFGVEVSKTTVDKYLKTVCRNSQTAAAAAVMTSADNAISINQEKQEAASTSTLTIGTHDGIFHCDEVLACFMLQQLPQYATAQIVRTRDQKLLDQCDIVVDVGGTFDRDRHRYDHHQASFNETFRSLRPELGSRWDIRLSSAGLVYTFFGEEVLKAILEQKLPSAVNPECLRAVYRKIYDGLISEIDAIDNGVPMYEGGEPRYNISTHLSARVGSFNAGWNEPQPAPNSLERFEKAKAYVGKEFVDKIMYYAESWWPARDLVTRALANRKSVHESGEILELEQFCPWKEHLYQLEEEQNLPGVAKYVIYFNRENDWRVICVPNQPSSFVCRKFLAKPWRGIRDEALEQLSGIPGANFVHQSGFIGGNKTREGVLQMAVDSLAAPEEK